MSVFLLISTEAKKETYSLMDGVKQSRRLRENLGTNIKGGHRSQSAGTQTIC